MLTHAGILQNEYERVSEAVVLTPEIMGGGLR
jgi:hypothetical protein